MKIVNFRAPEEEHSLWKTAAAEARVSFATFARRALNAAVGSGEVAPPTRTEPTAAPPVSPSLSGSCGAGDHPSGPAPAAIEKDLEVLRPPKPKKGKCEHRLPTGSFCKSCGKTKE